MRLVKIDDRKTTWRNSLIQSLVFCTKLMGIDRGMARSNRQHGVNKQGND